MSKLNAALAKKGIDTSATASKKKATDMKTVEASADIVKKVDRFLELESKLKDMKTESEVVCDSIRSFATEYIVKNHETENLIIAGTNGEINVNVKDQYTNATSEETRDEIAAYLKKFKIDADKHIKEESKVEFDFEALTDKERELLMNFITTSFGGDRFAQVVKTKTVYKLSGLKDEMIKKAKTVKDFEEFRKLTSHHSMTIVKRTTKA